MRRNAIVIQSLPKLIPTILRYRLILFEPLSEKLDRFPVAHSLKEPLTLRLLWPMQCVCKSWGARLGRCAGSTREIALPLCADASQRQIRIRAEDAPPGDRVAFVQHLSLDLDE